jgi:hypothetical protein
VRQDYGLYRLYSPIPLSGWTLRGSIQQFIDVYVSRTTFAEVERAFPYMVAREFASGGGDVSVMLTVPIQSPSLSATSQVPEFKWHIFEDKVPIDVADSGILITPFEGAPSYFLCYVSSSDGRQ